MKRFLLVSFLIVAAVILSRYFFKFDMGFYPRPLIRALSYSFAKLEGFGEILNRIENLNNLAKENEKLKLREKETLSLEARIDHLENENEFLRRAANIAKRNGGQIIDANIFNVSFGPSGYNVLLNKGSKDGVEEGDVLVTVEGVLIGRVEKALPEFSRVLFVYDSKFKITARVMGSLTAGIARGATRNGMYLDLIAQDDEIIEGDILLSSGDDMFPPALIIGKVKNVKINQNELFKEVRVEPAIGDSLMARILVLKK